MSKLLSNQGFIKLSSVLAITFAVGLAASAFLNYRQYQHAEQEKKLLQGEITDLRYQVQQDQLTAASPEPTTSPEPSPSATPSPSPSASPSPSPAVAGTAIITVSHYKVKLTAIDPILDLTYAPVKSGTLTIASFTTQSLVAKYPACKAGALGSLVRRAKSQKAPSSNKLVKTLGGYSFYYVAPVTTCTSDTAGRNTIAAARAALQNSVLPTLTY